MKHAVILSACRTPIGSFGGVNRCSSNEKRSSSQSHTCATVQHRAAQALGGEVRQVREVGHERWRRRIRPAGSGRKRPRSYTQVPRTYVARTAPAKTPPEIINRLSDVLRKAMQTPQLKEQYAREGGEPLPLETDSARNATAEEQVEATIAALQNPDIDWGDPDLRDLYLRRGRTPPGWIHGMPDFVEDLPPRFTADDEGDDDEDDSDDE